MYFQALRNAGFRGGCPAIEVRSAQSDRRGIKQANHGTDFFALLAADAAQQQLAKVLEWPVVTLVQGIRQGRAGDRTRFKMVAMRA
ncbi:hypothetical protein D3C84_715050 [compost metagenome]